MAVQLTDSSSNDTADLPRAPRRTGMTPSRRREALHGYLFVMPWIVGFFVFGLGPMIASLYFSLTDYNVVQSPVFIGLKNYMTMLSDARFWQSLKVTGLYVIIFTPLQLVLSFLVAMLLNQKVRAVGVWRTIFYIPNLVPAIASAMLWIWVLTPDFGLLNAALDLVGVHGPLWLASERWALLSVILVSLWSSIGAPMLIYLAGLQGIPSELYEAAECDGGGPWTKFRHITVPMMTPVILFNLIMSMVAAFQEFSKPYLLTNGGPADATLMYVLYIYQNAFVNFRMGYASALSWVLMVIILLLTLIVFRWSSVWVYYESEVKK